MRKSLTAKADKTGTMSDRISVRLPGKLLKAIDAKASKLDRSRSWIVNQALSRYAKEPAK